ncbi:hypothetical protein H4Q26_017205 [Puccinia striiformis f. sp. tritici PST-130]|nr:hypothetical protein H4Q26_017205 [Puccinia striiformis f. sp. tritici PST-130]
MPNQHHRAHIPTSTTTTTTTTTTTEAPPLTARSIQPQQPSGTLADLTACLRSTTGEIPPPLVGASITVLGTSIYVFGGRLVPTRLMISDMYRLDLNTLEWQKIWPEPSLGLRSDSKGKAKATESDLITQDPSSESTTTTTNEIQTPVIIPPRAPHPRYFHSAEAWGHKLVIFGGMGYAATPNKIHTQPTDSNHQPTESELGLCVLDDLVIFDSLLEPAQQIAMPSPRYAHLSCLTSETGYDLPINNNQSQEDSNDNNYMEISAQATPPIKILKPNRRRKRNLLTLWGTRYLEPIYSVACTAPLTVRQGDRLDGSDNPDHDEDRLRRLSWSEKPSVERPEPVYLYSNFNFNDVRRDLELISYPTTPPPPPASPSSTGTSLNQEKLRDQTDCFAIWALDLSQANHKHVPIKVPHVVWQRIDPGRIMMSGSWNRAVGWGNCLVILGNKDRDIVDDYHHRQINFVDLAFIDLEPFAIYQPPFSNQSYVPHGFSRETSLKSARLVIPLNKRMLEDRWPWFRERLNEFKLKATKVNVAYQKQIQEFCQSSKTIINNSNKSTTTTTDQSSHENSNDSSARDYNQSPSSQSSTPTETSGSDDHSKARADSIDSNSSNTTAQLSIQPMVTTNAPKIPSIELPESYQVTARSLYLPHPSLVIQGLIEYLFTTDLITPYTKPIDLVFDFILATTYQLEHLRMLTVHGLHRFLNPTHSKSLSQFGDPVTSLL